MENNNTIDNQYNIIRTLGQGGLSTVYLVRRINNNAEYAARVRLNNQNNPNILTPQHELQMTTAASALNNPNIIQLVAHGIGTVINNGIVTNNANYMIVEYCPKRDLFLYSSLRRFSERHAKYIFKKILLGVRALHEAKICHRDLKLDNVLLTQNFNIKISNFSLAARLQQNNLLNDFVGTIRYKSPQIVNHIPYHGKKADIFSLGVLLFALVSGIFGFNQATNHDPLYNLIINGNFTLYWAQIGNHIGNIHFSEEFKNLYIKMVDFNENIRPNIDEVLNNNWFNEINNLDEIQLNELKASVLNEFLEREN